MKIKVLERTCVDKKVIYFHIEVCLMKVPNAEKNVTFFFVVESDYKMGKKKSLCCIFNAGTRFLSTFVFRISA